MIRILIFILSVIFIAGAITVLAGLDGRTTAEAFGLKFDFHTGGAAMVLVATFVGSIFLTSVYKDLIRLPKDLRARDEAQRRARGVQALTRGLEAVAVGDADSARHHARVACRNLDESALTRLLTAQAAHLSGDEIAAKDSFTAMLAAPETEFLGLRGLFAQAMRAGDKEAAREHAERAFRLRPNAGWAFDAVIELGLERGAWSETRSAIEVARRHKIIDAEKAHRGEAALLAANAAAAAASGETAHALKEAEEALKLADSFAPAAVVAAALHEKAGRRNKAARLLEQAFATNPHPSLIAAHNSLYKDEPDIARAEAMTRIAEKRPDTRAARLQTARRHLLLNEHAAAADILEPLLVEAAYSGEYALMAAAVAGAAGQAGGAAARPWLERAAAAPRDPSPGADGSFHLTRAGWALLVREYMDHERLAPPPLEAAPPGVSEDEIRRLAAPLHAPPAEPAAEVEETASAGEAPTHASEPAPASKADGESGENEAPGSDQDAAARAVAAARGVS